MVNKIQQIQRKVNSSEDEHHNCQIKNRFENHIQQNSTWEHALEIIFTLIKNNRQNITFVNKNQI